jgi:hypothetical protein
MLLNKSFFNIILSFLFHRSEVIGFLIFSCRLDTFFRIIILNHFNNYVFDCWFRQLQCFLTLFNSNAFAVFAKTNFDFIVCQITLHCRRTKEHYSVKIFLIGYFEGANVVWYFYFIKCYPSFFRLLARFPYVNFRSKSITLFAIDQ